MSGCRAHVVNRGSVRTVLRGGDGLEVVISPDEAFVPIGERLNPTNKPRLQRAYDEGNWDYVQRDATRQVAAGAKVIDVNTGDPHHEIEARKMRDAVRAVQEVVDVPVSIDSYTIDVLLAGLEVARGRPLVNSVPFEAEYMQELLPAIAEHDACMIGMCTKGGAAMPETAEERVENARALVASAAEHGIAADRIVIDPVCLPVGANDVFGPGLLGAIRTLHREDDPEHVRRAQQRVVRVAGQTLPQRGDSAHGHGGRSDGGDPGYDPQGNQARRARRQPDPRAR